MDQPGKVERDIPWRRSESRDKSSDVLNYTKGVSSLKDGIEQTCVFTISRSGVSLHATMHTAMFLSLLQPQPRACECMAGHVHASSMNK